MYGKTYCQWIIKNKYRDGSRISAGSEISEKYYKESDVENLEKIKKLDDKIDSLEKVKNSVKNSKQNLNDFNNKIYAYYLDLNDEIKQIKYQSYSKIKNQNIECFNKKQIFG